MNEVRLVTPWNLSRLAASDATPMDGRAEYLTDTTTPSPFTTTLLIAGPTGGGGSQSSVFSSRKEVTTLTVSGRVSGLPSPSKSFLRRKDVTVATVSCLSIFALRSVSLRHRASDEIVVGVDVGVGVGDGV